MHLRGILTTTFHRFVLCLTMTFLLLPLSFGSELPERVVSFSPAARPPEPVVLRYLTSYPHDITAFTQGLLWHDGFLYESTGNYGHSTLRRVEPTTGRVTARLDLPQRYFGEGLALVGDLLFLLTWRENVCFVFDKRTFQLQGRFHYPGEGWGLTYDGELLIMSDGSNMLRFIDPKTFEMKRRVEVTVTPRGQRPVPVRHLNELEWIRGEVWANVWQTTRTVRIDPRNGNVLGWFEMAPFVPAEHRGDFQNSVLNGIAFDPATNHVYITGKNWNVMYKFQIESPEARR